MLKSTRLFILLAIVGILAAGCSQQDNPLDPGATPILSSDKDGDENLGDPSIDIANGSGIVQAGVGMQVQPATLEINVPGTAINQVLLYWSGGTTEAPYLGDNAIMVGTTEVTGELIGGPSYFFGQFYFTAYRADITELGLVTLGANSFQISGMDYIGSVTTNENNGVGMIVIYADGSSADIQLRDGLDLAFYNFPEPRQSTVPQTYNFEAAGEDRVADLVIMAGSVHEERPNEILVTVGGAEQSFLNVLESADGLQWDSITLDVDIPAGASSLTVELISIEPETPEDPMGASMSWVAGALSVPVVELQPASIGDFVWNDVNMNGIQEGGEEGIEEVVVHLLDCNGNVLDTTETDTDGMYFFTQLMPGDYNLHFVLPDGYVFSPQNQGNDPALDSDADPATGMTDCTTLVAGENDYTWDAGMYMPVQEGCTRTKGYWMTHAGFGPQDDMVTPLLPIWLGDADGDKSIAVTDNSIAYDILGQHEYGHPNNGITKLYAQLLAAKLNFASGASGEDVADTVDDADAFLADYDWNDWGSLSDADKDMVLGWQGMLDNYNKGVIGPGHCDDVEEEEEDSKKVKFQ